MYVYINIDTNKDTNKYDINLKKKSRSEEWGIKKHKLLNIPNIFFNEVNV